ncbi:MAG: hypothetical protein E6Q93_22055 [Burkholderiaceae bacterium]|nr:MAG: hypothetical protein E6Q93_22055 [Burkholderiaceae bacterium]
MLLGNQLGGWLMLALAWRLAIDPLRADTRAVAQVPATWPHQLTSVASILWLAQAALGSLSGQMVPSMAAAAHLLVATALLPLTLWCAWRARAGPRPLAARAVLVLALFQAVSGLAAAAAAAPAERVWWHAVLGAAGFALLTNLHAPVRVDSRT